MKVIAAREGKSSSELIMQVIEAYVKAHSEGNDTFKLDTWVNDSTFRAVPTILEKNNQKWIEYVNSCNADEKRDLTISCNFVLKIIQSLEVKNDIQISNNKAVQYDRLRQSNDIRNKDPSTLTIYQREQLKRYQEALSQ